ncbi:HisA/HisF-related TIM barrel protein, partial [Candidatus Hodgkinia cicadicola]|uniref:HisA/HisF-related TIM barrel protein n=1 Tax=Candidatus Hodgkinia cicadicola TaxID=573658 RepID=UPI0024159172
KAGADKVAINSASVMNPEFIANCVERFGSQCIVSSVDCKAVNGTWEVFSHSGLRSTGIDWQMLDLFKVFYCFYY